MNAVFQKGFDNDILSNFFDIFHVWVLAMHCIGWNVKVLLCQISFLLSLHQAEGFHSCKAFMRQSLCIQLPYFDVWSLIQNTPTCNNRFLHIVCGVETFWDVLSVRCIRRIINLPVWLFPSHHAWYIISRWLKSRAFMCGCKI